MMGGETQERTPSAGLTAEAPAAPPPYAPPAVAWEEEFEPLAQATNGGTNPVDPGCVGRGDC